MPSSLNGAFHYCRWLTSRSGSHFASSFLLLPPARRRGMEAVYAFCRAMDDIVDREGVLPEEARRELEAWRRELEACEQGFPAHPIAVAIAEIRQRYGIPMDLFRKLITGVEMDLGSRRYGTFEELKVYCEHVASVVGLISVRVFGCRHPDADRYAVDLGIALQLTNILRDLKTDAVAGRSYLPAEDLRRFGVSESELSSLAVRADPEQGRRIEARQRSSFDKLRMTGELSDQFRELMAFECERAWQYFEKARQALRSSREGRKLLPARIMGGVYARLLHRIQESGYDVFSRRLKVTHAEQVWIAANSFIRSS